MANPDARPVRRLGIDEHRYRRVRFFRDPTTAKWRRYEPWMTTMVDLDTGVVLGVVDGRGSAGVKAWLEARSLAWLCGVQVVARSTPVRRSARPSATRCLTPRYRSIIFT
jgi:transposase